MISVTRVLSFDEFAASNRLALLHGTIGRKVSYIACCFVLPIISLVALPIAGWLLISTWQRSGNHADEFGVLSGVFAMFLVFLFWPLLFRRKMRKLYRQQQLERVWEIEVSERGVHSKLVGLADTHLEWVYFDYYVETPNSFVLLKKLRPVFLTIGAISLDTSQKTELRGLLDAHLARKG